MEFDAVKHLPLSFNDPLEQGVRSSGLSFTILDSEQRMKVARIETRGSNVTFIQT